MSEVVEVVANGTHFAAARKQHAEDDGDEGVKLAYAALLDLLAGRVRRFNKAATSAVSSEMLIMRHFRGSGPV